MTPTKEDLNGSPLADIAICFGVSERTARRWLKALDIYEPRKGYGPGKISDPDALDIRISKSDGESVKSLANRYNVSPATIYRIVAGQTHRVIKETALVSVIYNPDINRHLS